MQQPLPRTKTCFVCGRDNPGGLRLSFETDGQAVWGRWLPAPEHVGFKGTIHGGLTATLLDEVMTWVCGVVSGKFCYCAELVVRYAHPLHPGAEVKVRAELTGDRRGRLFEAQAEAVDGEGRVCARATGKYLPVPGETLVDMMDDIVGDISLIIRSPRPASAATGEHPSAARGTAG